MGNRGFSLIEVMIAGALMVGLGFAAYQLLGNVSSATGDIEKRGLYRDLVEDIRFVFSQPSLCEEAVQSLSFVENAPASVALRPGTMVQAGASLPGYGLKVTSFTVKNVRTFPSTERTLLSPTSELLGNYFEEGAVADLYLEVSTLGSNHVLKGQIVSRIAVTHRRGAVTEDLCYGNHEMADGHGQTGAAGQGSNVISGNRPNRESFPERVQPDRGGSAPMGPGQNGGHAACVIDDPIMSSALHQRRLLHGVVEEYRDAQGRLNRITCSNGSLTVLRRE